MSLCESLEERNPKPGMKFTKYRNQSDYWLRLNCQDWFNLKLK